MTRQCGNKAKLTNVVSIRRDEHVRKPLADFQKLMSSMERIVEALDGTEPADENTICYLLRDVLRDTPIITGEIPPGAKERFGYLYQQLGDLNLDLRNRLANSVLMQKPDLVQYLRDNKFICDDSE